MEGFGLMAAMLTLEEAQERLIALAPKMDTIRPSTQHALGQYLASDVRALRTQPPADLSAMDGYAICGDGPWERVGESRAGAPFAGALEPGQCTRISTGAHMPQGSDRVLIQENAEVVDGRVALLAGEELPPPNRHVRKAGFDFGEGDTVHSEGTRMGPAQIALALAAGHADVPVHARPSVGILDSGDELVRLPAPCGPHQIPASNGPMLAAMVEHLVGMVEPIGPVPDDLDALAKALEASKDKHILVTSGGASVGDHDLVQQALKNWGARLDFWKVAIKPGKPLMVATREADWGKQVIVGLPGNPVSSFVTCFLFVLPLVRAAMGDPEPLPYTVTVRSAQDLPAVGMRREFLRGVRNGDEVHLASSQDSSALLALASANCLIDRPAGAETVRAGEPVRVFNLHNG